ncbi:MAG: lamin tail domain-containing protein [Verrucomicrobiota bacterium]|nr:lamin tail domain-containing protein [Verrucomicrobiota bacterium]
MKKGLMFLAAAAGLVAARAEVVLDESFSYDDGPIVVQAADTWKNHNGINEQTEVYEGQLILTQANTEDFHAKLAGGPYMKSSGGTMYASFDVEFTELPSGDGSYFAHFRDDGFGYQARIVAQSTGAEGGAFRIGVTSKGKASTAVVDNDLHLDTVYKVVIAMSLADASTTLWIDPDGGAAGGVTTTDNGSAVDVTGFAFRQANNIGAMLIDNLKVGTILGDVIDDDWVDVLTILSQPVSQTVLAGKSISFSVLATGAEPLAYQWSRDGVDIGGATSSALELSNVSADDTGDYVVTVSNASGSVVSSDTATLKVQDSPGGDVVTIKHLRSLVDDNREPSDTKTIFTAEGIVTSHTNMTGGSHSLFYFQDGTAGIAVYFRSGKSSHPKPGDKVRVSAPLSHFYGLLQFVPDAGNAMHLVKVVSSNNALPEAAKLDFMQSDDAAAMEALEGSFVVASEVEIDSGGDSKFSGAANYTLTDADGMTFTIRIDSRIRSIIGQPFPSTVVNVTGVLSQYTHDRPREGGYQLMPTRIEDISGPKLPTIEFTLKYDNLIRPGRPIESSRTDHFLLPGETAVIEAVVKSPSGNEVTVTPTGDWLLSANPAIEVTAKLVLTAGEADAGEPFDLSLEAENNEGVATLEWDIYVPSVAEQQVAVTEFLANPTGKATDGHYNPLHRETPSDSNQISVEDEFIEIANLGQADVDLAGWSVSDAVALRSNFYEGDVLAKRGAVIVYGGRSFGSEPVLGEGVLALPATESTSGLGLNNSGDTITLRNADGHVIDRIQFGKPTGKGSMTRHPGLNGVFADHSTVAGPVVSAGTWPSGAPYTEDAVVEIPEVAISVSLTDGEVSLDWEASPAASYSVKASGVVAGPYEPVAEALKFDGGAGAYSVQADQAARFFIIEAK